VNSEVHTFIVKDQCHPQMIEFHAQLQRLSGLMLDVGYVPLQNLFCLWKKKNRCLICVSIVRNWLLHLGSSTQLLVVLSE
jgi:hypothetical protein